MMRWVRGDNTTVHHVKMDEVESFNSSLYILTSTNHIYLTRSKPLIDTQKIGTGAQRKITTSFNNIYVHQIEYNVGLHYNVAIEDNLLQESNKRYIFTYIYIYIYIYSFIFALFYTGC